VYGSPLLAYRGPLAHCEGPEPDTVTSAADVGKAASALVRVSGRHCAGRGKAPARAWCRWSGVREVCTVGMRYVP